MKYKKIDENHIEISPEKTPVKRMLETIARVSYELARPAGLGFLRDFDTKSEDIDFSKLVNLKDPRVVLDMDYVNGRQCKTVVLKKNGKYIFNAHVYRLDRGDPQLFLNKVNSALEEKIEKAGISKFKKSSSKSDKPPYWDRIEVEAAKYNINIDPAHARESRLKVSLALDADGRPMEAIEIMQGRDFNKESPDAFLLMTHATGSECPTHFYVRFPNIDKN